MQLTLARQRTRLVLRSTQLLICVSVFLELSCTPLLAAAATPMADPNQFLLGTNPQHGVIITNLPTGTTLSAPMPDAAALPTTSVTINPAANPGSTVTVQIPMTTPSQYVEIKGVKPGLTATTSESQIGGIEYTTVALAPSAGGTNACNNVNSFTNDCLSNWGFGVGIGEFFYGNADIRSAELETVTVSGPNGTTTNESVVRVTESHKREASIWAEMHYVWPVFYLPGPLHVGPRSLLDLSFLSAWHIGPFAAVQVGGNTGVFDSLALGVMNSFPISESSNQAFGIGLGYGWTQVTLLGDGIVANQPLPAGVTNIRYLKRDIGGPVIMLSYHFR